MDNIIYIYYKRNLEKFKDFEFDLLSVYDIRLLKNITNFLNIRIIRDRSYLKIYLIQNEHIDKI